MLKVETIPPKAAHEATVIIFHGSGDDAANFKESLRDVRKNFKYDNIKIVFPSAAPKAYTAAGGMPSTVWYDRVGGYKDNPESRQSIKDAYKVVEALIAEEASNGIPPEKIVVGGFSMGGGPALHAGIKVNRKLANPFQRSFPTFYF